ncbi:MAG: META domain-containing protein [Gordonia sp. (in: high G+C Gram-positive bacteria)]|uniref:META domain-containing protein n=1 Tax=Gordonia sp. (in: high G+C Gram-positive bacteria) TaxID=84139 RepID=UPI0039E3F284
MSAFRTIRTVSVLVLLGAAAVAGCARSDGQSPADPSMLAGTTFLASADGVTGPPIPGGGPLEVSFPEKDRISATAGCNRHNGGVSFDGHTLTAGPLASTMMACPGERMQADAWLADLFSAPLQWSVGDDHVLTLSRGDRTVRLAPRRDLPLEGTTWKVTALVRNQGVESSVALNDAAPHLTIDDGRASGFAGCNDFGGPATVSGDTVDFGRPVATVKACAPEINDVEGAVLSVLTGAVKYAIEGDQLSLTNVASPDLGLRLTAN